MDTSAWVEVIGYVASALIIVSITQKSILRLRLFGLIGGTTFFIYALIIEAYPIAALNVVGVSVHLWHLRKLIRRKDEIFRVLRVLPDSTYLLNFLDFYADEIQGHFQPEFVYEQTPNLVTAFILRDMVPAGLLIGEPCDDGTFEMKLDFVIPQYRDFRIGAYVYGHDAGFFDGIGPSSVWATASNKIHADYLHKMGFVECATMANRYEILLDERSAAIR